MSAPARKSARRGFTLIEVIVALSAGTLVTMAAFMLSKGATSFFQYEARVSTAQLGLTLAMNRLTNDIQRASMFSTPNIQADPTVCRTGVSWPTGLSNLAGITILAGATATPEGKLQTPAMAPPDTLIVGGSMDSTEVFQVQSIVSNAGAPQLIIRGQVSGQYTDPATYRAYASVGSIAGDMPCRLKPFFTPNTYPPTGPQPPGCAPPISSGRFGHIYQPETNTHWYGVIDTFTIDANNAINVQFKSIPGIPAKPGVSCGLGVGDTGGGWLFNVVSRVQYDVMSLVGTAAQYGPIVAPGALGAVTGDTTRTELVRRELDASGAPMDWGTGLNTTEVVAEYAVDLRFGITVATQITNNNYNPTVTTYAVNDPTGTIYKQANLLSANGQPEYIRAVQVRLSVRTRAPDRDSDLPAGPDGRRLRYLILDPSIHPAYARVRTNYANVTLPNQGGFSLW